MNTPYSSSDVCRIVGITFRRLDYWIRIGATDATDGGFGSGNHRAFSRADISNVALLAEVTDWVWSPTLAAEMLSALGPDAIRANGTVTLRRDGAVSLVVDLDELERLIDERISAAFPEERATA